MRSGFTTRALEALDWAQAQSIPVATRPEHVLMALLDQDATIVEPVFEALGVDADDLRRSSPSVTVRRGAAASAAAPGIDADMASLLRAAEHEARQLSDHLVSIEHLLIALAGRRDGVGEALRAAGADRSSMLEAVRRVRGPAAVVDAEPERTYLGVRWRPPAVSSQVLRYSRDLTELAFRAELDPVVGRDAEIERVIQVLSRRRKNNPVLIGDPGVGKTAIAEGLAQRIVAGDVPAALLNRRVIALDVGALVAGATYRGEFEDRVKSLLKDVVGADGGIIVFIDELHTIVGAGAAEGAVDAGNLLKPMLARGEFRTLGATTLDEYRKHVESDGALERRFQPVRVDEPSSANALEMLRGLRSRYESHHGVAITDAALSAAVSLSDRYIADRFLPDKAIDLIDEACSRRRIQSDSLSSVTRGAGSCTPPLVDDDDIARLVGQWTGIPVSRLQEEELERLVHMEHRLAERVVGQAKAVVGVSAALRNSRTGLSDPNRPIASLMFCGPLGVGKTYLARVLADVMLDSGEALVQLDMSDYAEKHSVTRLVGASPGYVGYEEGGQLTDAVRRRPYCVVLLDDIEQAHPDVHGLLRQVIDDGSLTDGQGRVVSFRHVILVMTSSLPDLGAVNQHFRAEFLTRLDDVLEFAPLRRKDLEQLVDIQVRSVAARLSDRGIALELTHEARALIAELGDDSRQGARPLVRVVQKELISAVSRSILLGDACPGDTIRVDQEGTSVTLTVLSRPAEAVPQLS
ncbi:putative ATP-dependent Clp protease ATP-binding subunit [Rhodococcus opacus B4]|uniref:Putative ATP-dependent Clp protease ATP-binding subunit n=1 Tax=Rhodococcus opacus (strain B4) TaxID=632772 RepID=C1ASB5_RHOOB|nr:putative ATP-dependent Clp protease ATP-binding subunit [Rhodococcus opacus B4]